MFREESIQDIELYKTACPLGWNLDQGNYQDLGSEIKKMIGDDSCEK